MQFPPITLHVVYDPLSDQVQVTGVPMAQDASGRKLVLTGLCAAAFARALDEIKKIDPNATSPILQAREVPNGMSFGLKAVGRAP